MQARTDDVSNTRLEITVSLLMDFQAETAVNKFRRDKKLQNKLTNDIIVNQKSNMIWER